MDRPDLTMLETYFRLMNLNGAAQVYHTALDVGLLDSLRQGAKTAAQAADACGLEERPTALLLDALQSLGLLVRRGDEYALAEVAHLLLGSEYRELGSQYWRHLPTLLRTGVPLVKMDDAAESESHYQTQAAMLGWMLSHAAAEAADRLEFGTARRNVRILDLGAGSGVWSLTMASRDAGTRVTAVDWPAVLEVAEETAENLGIRDRLTTLPGNFHEVALPEAAFDLAVVANVTHLQTPEQNAALFRKLHAALAPGGELVIIDALPGSSLGDTPLALYHLGLVLRTEHGRVYSPAELTEMLGHDFEPTAIIPLDAPPHVVGLLLARKA
jgi:2-polyprenyl-3-methyl-5-hydroxy-6-metoxy-1,4-benzoquinol methylase